MLVEFKVKNFLSFKEETSFTMEAASFRKEEDHPQNVFEAHNKRLRLLKSSVIYGPNASGKSNLFKSLFFMMSFVRESVRIHSKKSEIFPFLLDKATAHVPSKFEVTFIKDETKYRYGFELDKERVHSEWLYICNTREVLGFTRNLDDYEFNKKYFKKTEDLKEKTRPDALFLTVASDYASRVANIVVDWFGSLILPGIIPDYGLIEREGYIDKITAMIKMGDVGIEKIEISEKELDEKGGEIFAILIKNIPDLKKMKEMKFPSISSFHKQYDKEKDLGKLVEIPWDFESTGTHRLFIVAPHVIDALMNGKILVIDELDKSLHPHMAEAIISLFNSYANKNNAQLIFNTHNTSFLNTRKFRRDQIWFTEKNRFGATELFSLSDFGVRKDESLEKKYLFGVYGAVPSLGDFSSIFSEEN